VPDPVEAIAEWLSFPLADDRSRESDRWSLAAEEVTILFQDLRSSLLRYTMSLGLTVQDGEDIVQEAFLSLFSHLIRGRSRANLRGWIFRVTHNLALKRRRRNHRNSESTIGDFVELLLKDPALNPEEQVAQNRRHASVLAVVQALPERDRCCLTLRAEGLRYREIAETVGISLGGVAFSLSRSMAKLSRVGGR
jgi:RNA polymerase sigma-70 factor (ECF subfamily)